MNYSSIWKRRLAVISKSILPLVLINALILFALPIYNPVRAIEIPDEYFLKDDSVPRNMVMEIASKKAEQIWGDVLLGPVIPMVDNDKNLIAYYVVFSRNGKPFPDYPKLLREIQEGRELRNEGLREMSEQGKLSALLKDGKLSHKNSDSVGKNLKYDWGRRKAWGIDDYCTILITARYSLKPIPEYFEGLPRLFTMGDYIENVASTEIGANPVLKYIYYFGRLEQIYGFQKGENICYVDPFPVSVVSMDDFQRRIASMGDSDCKIDEDILNKRQDEWCVLYNNPPAISTIIRVDHFDWIPIYLWTAGCAPTAAAMALGLYDNKYDVSGYYNGYGRFCFFYKYEKNFTCSDSGALRQSIPNSLDELRYAMNTNCSGGTNLDSVSPGIEYVVNSVNQYFFDIIETQNCDIPGNDCYDWCWGEITEQIDDDFPFVWVITCHDCPPGTNRGHALTAFGYNDIDQTIAVYNTWDEQEHWWCHDHYGNNCDWFAHATWVHAIRPAGGDFPADIRLSSPVGGESLLACREDTIRWYQWGNDITQVTIRYSTDSGVSWPSHGYIAVGHPSAGQGWHEYVWLPGVNVAGDNLRITIMGLDDYGRLIASEGSPGDFTLHGDYVVGDVNGNGDYNGMDITYGVNFFKGGPPPAYECECTPGNIWFIAGDANGSCSYNGLDITYGMAYFKGGSAPLPCGDCPPN